MIDRPTYTEKIMAYTDTPFVKILTGVRRCGKSTILKMIMDKLRQRGVPAEQIAVSDACTMCRPDVFWSHRATDGRRGVQAAVITL